MAVHLILMTYDYISSIFQITTFLVSYYLFIFFLLRLLEDFVVKQTGLFLWQCRKRKKRGGGEKKTLAFVLFARR